MLAGPLRVLAACLFTLIRITLVFLQILIHLSIVQATGTKFHSTAAAIQSVQLPFQFCLRRINSLANLAKPSGYLHSVLRWSKRKRSTPDDRLQLTFHDVEEPFVLSLYDALFSEAPHLRTTLCLDVLVPPVVEDTGSQSALLKFRTTPSHS